MAARPKPSYPDGKKPPYSAFLDWLDRQFVDAFSTTYTSFAAIVTVLHGHASRHIRSGADEIDGDKIDIDFVPTNYTRTLATGFTTSTQELTSHLKGIDNAISGTPAAHASSHIHGGSDAVDGDRLDVDYSPANYTRTPGNNGTVDNDELTSHLTGIDDAMLKAKTVTYYGRQNNATGTASATIYLCPTGAEALTGTTTIADSQVLWGRAGTIKNFRARQLTSSGDADTYDLFINVNGSNTSITLTGIAGNNTSIFRDTTHTATVAVEDLVVIAKVNGGAAVLSADLVWCFDFVEAL